MIPKIDVRFSFIYNKNFNPDFSISDLVKLREDSRSFVKLVNEKIKDILGAIESSGEPWKRECIPIYIVSGKMKSFSDPLTLRYREDDKLLLLILIHELIHNNMTKKYRDTLELHRALDKIYRKVVEDLDLPDFEKAQAKYDSFCFT